MGNTYLTNFHIRSTEREPRAEAVAARPSPPGVPVRVGRRLREERTGAAGLAHLDHVDQRRRPRDAQGQDAQPGRAANGASRQSAIRWVHRLDSMTRFNILATVCKNVLLLF